MDRRNVPRIESQKHRKSNRKCQIHDLLCNLLLSVKNFFFFFLSRTEEVSAYDSERTLSSSNQELQPQFV